MTYLYIFYLGACLSSFILLIVQRGQQNRPILFSRSTCDHCEKILPFRSLLPLISMITHKCHCNYCNISISPRYFICESLGGLVALFIWLNPPTLLMGILIIFAFAQSLSDSFYLRINAPLYFLSLLLSLSVIFWQLPFSDWLSRHLMPGILLFSGLSIARSFKPRSLGLGDIKLLVAWLLVLSFDQLIQILFFASLGGIIYIQLYKIREPIPFVPFLFIGLLLSSL